MGMINMKTLSALPFAGCVPLRGGEDADGDGMTE